jgi:hypothetical protein
MKSRLVAYGAAFAALVAPFAALAFLIITPTFTPVAAIAQWRLNAANMSGNTVLDSSGNGNNASFPNGAVPFGTSGAIFDGVNDYIEQTSLFTTATPAFSVAMWVKPTATSVFYSFIGNAEPFFTNNGFFLFVFSDNNIYFDVANGTTFGRASGASGFTAGTFYHLAGTYNGANVILYKNGVQLMSTAFTGNMATSSFNLMAGVNPNSVAQWFSGEMSDIRIYNQAISAGQVSSLFSAGVP